MEKQVRGFPSECTAEWFHLHVFHWWYICMFFVYIHTYLIDAVLVCLVMCIYICLMYFVLFICEWLARFLKALVANECLLVRTHSISFDIHSICSSFPLPPHPLVLSGKMDSLTLTLREWPSMEIGNGDKLVRFLNIISFLLENIFDSFSGKHWGFMCSCIHAAFSGHFEPISNFFVSHPPTSIYFFSSSFLGSEWTRLISDANFANILLRELA